MVYDLDALSNCFERPRQMACFEALPYECLIQARAALPLDVADSSEPLRKVLMNARIDIRRVAKGLREDAPRRRDRLRSIQTLLEKIHPLLDAKDLRNQAIRMARELRSELRAVDIVGFHIAWIFESRMLAYCRRNHPLDRRTIDTLHNGAILIVANALPELVDLACDEESTSDGEGPRVRLARLESVYATWIESTYFPLLRDPRADIGIELSDTARHVLNTLWLSIRAMSAIRFDFNRMVSATLEAFISKRSRDSLERQLRTDPRKAGERADLARGYMKMLCDRPDAFEHLALGRSGHLIINHRRVRDRLGETFGVGRDRGREPLSHSDLGASSRSTSSPSDDASFTVDDLEGLRHGVDGLSALREFREIRGRDEERAVADEIVSEVESDPNAGFGQNAGADLTRLGAVLRHYVARTASLESSSLRAAVTWELFSSRFSREDLAVRYRCSAKSIERKAEHAKSVARTIRAAAM